jgi:putative ABC transport system ATP-binding protein
MSFDNRVIIQAANLSKEYSSGGRSLPILSELNLDVCEGEIVAIVGPSGSGKSTLLSLLGGLDVPTTGRVILDGRDITDLPERRLAHIRNEKVGFVFQFFYLVPTLTALENVLLPMQLSRSRSRDTLPNARARELLALVGLQERSHHRPSQLSGGEQQRVAIARALANSPRIILADEPTGNLDANTRTKILELILTIHRQMGMTFVIATHDATIASHASRILRLDGGNLAESFERRQ